MPPSFMCHPPISAAKASKTKVRLSPSKKICCICFSENPLKMMKNDHLKICNVRTWETNNYNTHIAQYVKKKKQSDNAIWSINRI